MNDRTTGKKATERRLATAPRFHLVRHFAIVGFAAFGLTAAVLAWHEGRQGEFFRNVQQDQLAFVADLQDGFARRQDEAARRDLLAVQEGGNANLARLFANTLWKGDIAPFVARAQAIPLEHCRALADAPARAACAADIGRRLRALPGFDALDAKVRDAMKSSTVFRIRVLDTRGTSVYSSRPEEVGEDLAESLRWQDAMAGRASSELTHRHKLDTLQGAFQERDTISSFLPVWAPGGDSVVGVFEICSDVTPLLARIQATSSDIRVAAARDQASLRVNALRNQDESGAMSLTAQVIVIWLLGALFGVLCLIVRRADRLLRGQELERERANQQLAQSEKLASLGQMAAGVAHQLNTPLAFSHSNVSLVLARLEELERALRACSKSTDAVVVDIARPWRRAEPCLADPAAVGEMREMLGDVLRGVDQMAELVAHMRNFTRLDQADTTAFDLNKGLASVVYIARSVIPSRVRVEESYDALPPIDCNPSQLNQVFLNLISNAVQAIAGTGTVTVRTRRSPGRVCVEVADTGSGIAPDVLPRIFETYFTTKPEGEGTGLGLTIARDIVRNHGGDIEVASVVGKGSTFTVWLPASAAETLLLAA